MCAVDASTYRRCARACARLIELRAAELKYYMLRPPLLDFGAYGFLVGDNIFANKQNLEAVPRIFLPHQS